MTPRDIGKERCGIVSFTLDGMAAGEAKDRLQALGINVSVSSPDSTLLDATARQLPPLLRASAHYYNDAAEVERLLAALKELAG